MQPNGGRLPPHYDLYEVSSRLPDNKATTMLAPTFMEMPPLVSASTSVSPIYGTTMPGPYMGSVSPTPYQPHKTKRNWLNRVTTSPMSSPRMQHQQLQHPAALLHRDYLQEYREKYGALSPEHRMSQLVVDPWYTPVAHHIHPAVVAAANTSSTPVSSNGICACPGTKKLGKPCKKCGLRVAAVNKGGTVRGGTVRGSQGTKVRPALNLNVNAPTISPMRLRPTPTTPQDEERKIIQADPYNIMRRSRLSLQEKQGSIRTRSKSVSPTRARLSYPPSIPAARTTFDTHRSRLDEWVASNDTPPLSSRSNSSDSESSSVTEHRNKSILECDVSAYELLTKYLHPDPYESDDLSDNAILEDDNKKWLHTPTTIPRISKHKSHHNNNKVPIVEKITDTEPSNNISSTNSIDRTISMPSILNESSTTIPKPPPRRRRINKKSIKSILKKTSVSSVEDNPSITTTTSSSIHFPTYQEFKQRKKQVQFKSNSIESNNTIEGKCSIPTNDIGLKVQQEGFTHGDGERNKLVTSQQQQQTSQKCSTTSSSDDDELSIRQVQSEVLDTFSDTKQQESDIITKDVQQESEQQKSPQLEETSSANKDEINTKFNKSPLPQQPTPTTKVNKRREGGSIVHIRGDHHKLFIDTMRLRMAPHHRGDSRNAFQPVRMLSPTRPKEPPPPPPPPSLTSPDSPTKSDVIIVTKPDAVVTTPDAPLNNSTIVTVNDEIITDTSSIESDYNTLRINIGNNNDLATILTVGDNNDVNNIESSTLETIPHICSKNEITISDTSIIEKVENKRRSKILSSIESPYVSTSIKITGASDDNWNNPVTVVIGDNNKKWTTESEKKDDTSVTDDESSTRSKFYVTVEDEDEFYDEEIEDHYEMIRDPIYEEISEPQAKSIFEGASKYDILNYLVGARERGIPLESSPAQSSSILLPTDLGDTGELLGSELGSVTSPPCSELVSHVSDSSEDTAPAHRSSPAKSRRSSAEIERNDSGVGSETSQSSRSRWLLQRRTLTDHQADLLCEDCEQSVEPQVTDSGVVYAPLVCRKCGKRRSERREIITELLETEVKYGRDLRIMTEEFYRPMLVAGLLSQEQLDAIFLNVPELLDVSRQLAERLQDAVDIALDQGDEDLLTVNVGRQLLDCSHMLHAFETYCTRQGAASVLLSSLEKDKELLKIFLRVSQMENAVLRRMNLNSFLMVPVQRVTKYPLLLARLYKATPPHYDSRELLKQAQQKIEAHLEHMNAEAKDLSATKLWRRISIINVPYRKISSEPDMNIRLRKLALEVLGWSHEESSFVMEGRLLFTQPTDSNWRKGRTIKLSHLNALLITHGKGGSSERLSDQDALTFPKDTGTREAALLLLKEKAGRCSLLREPLSLDKCIICAELQDIEDCFEVQEIPTKDTFIFKAETTERTREWFRRLQFHAQGLGGWRRRRNALANIMMNGMIPRC